MAAAVLSKETRRHLSVTKLWCYVLAAIEALFVLMAVWTVDSHLAKLVTGIVLGIPMILKVRAARNIARFEQGDEAAVVRAIWFLRHLWVTLTIYGALWIVAVLALVALRVLRAPIH